MKIEFNKHTGITEKSSTINTGGRVKIGNVKRTRVFLDQWGNEIDPKTKQIIKRADQE